jgi:hypothetical protein
MALMFETIAHGESEIDATWMDNLIQVHTTFEAAFGEEANGIAEEERERRVDAFSALAEPFFSGVFDRERRTEAREAVELQGRIAAMAERRAEALARFEAARRQARTAGTFGLLGVW